MLTALAIYWLAVGVPSGIYVTYANDDAVAGLVAAATMPVVYPVGLTLISIQVVFNATRR